MDRVRPSSLEGEEIVLHCWQCCDDVNLELYFRLKEELSVSENCFLHGGRVVVPEQGRRVVPNELHIGHPVFSRMRGRTGSDKDADMFVKNCSEHQLHEKMPPIAPLHPWE